MFAISSTFSKFSQSLRKARSLALAATAVAAAAAASTSVAAAADTPTPTGESFMKGRSFVAADYSAGKVHIVGGDGKITWSHPAASTNDVWILPSGNLLFAKGNGAKEVSRDGTVKFEYTTKAEVYAVQRLPDGNTFVGECSSGKLLVVAPDGKKLVKEVPLLAAQTTPKRPFPGGHLFMRGARFLPNGHFLTTRYQKGEVVEHDADGKVVWSAKVPGGAHSVVRTANGHTFAAAGDGRVNRRSNPAIYEFDAAGKVVWQVTNDDLPGRPLRFCGGFQILPNGNILLSNWVGHGQFGKAPHLLEITRDKKVVWTYDDHKQFKTIASVHVFGEDGKPLSGDGFH
jgi:outer membrane protein assembly factor BamB